MKDWDSDLQKPECGEKKIKTSPLRAGRWTTLSQQNILKLEKVRQIFKWTPPSRHEGWFNTHSRQYKSLETGDAQPFQTTGLMFVPVWPINTRRYCNKLFTDELFARTSNINICASTGWLRNQSSPLKNSDFLLQVILNGCFMACFFSFPPFKEYLRCDFHISELVGAADVLSARSIRSLSWLPHFNYNTAPEQKFTLSLPASPRARCAVLAVCHLAGGDESRKRKAEVTVGRAWEGSRARGVCLIRCFVLPSLRCVRLDALSVVLRGRRMCLSGSRLSVRTQPQKPPSAFVISN